MLRTIIPGPPGTGKTHRLMHYLEQELKQAGTPTQGGDTGAVTLPVGPQ